MGDRRGHNKFDLPGICAVLTSLCFDALASNMEDKVMSVYGASQSELISMLYSIGALVVGIVAVLTGQMQNGIQRCIDNPMAIVFIFLFSFLGALGIQFVYLLMKVFGSLLTVMATSVRKAVTVLLSFVVFKDKKFTSLHVYAILLIATGMGLNIYERTGHVKKEETIDDIEEEPMMSPMEALEYDDV
jgi:adenosine 3'-phospho 5'-phosphosulfate transporter B3